MVVGLGDEAHVPNPSKHVDSHIKPYRCNDHQCSSQQFSSTACLLRHEREAHGMHGHGDKPYPCPYPDCDRSGTNGFPRRWNLGDHIKRVHDQRMASAPHGADYPLPSSGSSSLSQQQRRRRSSTTQASKKTRSPVIGRAKAGSNASDRTRPRGQREKVHKGLREEEAALRDSLRAYSRTLNASRDTLGRAQLEERTQVLRIVGQQFHQLHSSSMSVDPRHGFVDGYSLATPD